MTVLKNLLAMVASDHVAIVIILKRIVFRLRCTHDFASQMATIHQHTNDHAGTISASSSAAICR